MFIIQLYAKRAKYEHLRVSAINVKDVQIMFYANLVFGVAERVRTIRMNMK
jgi:hypothetical protein